MHLLLLLRTSASRKSHFLCLLSAPSGLVLGRWPAHVSHGLLTLLLTPASQPLLFLICSSPPSAHCCLPTNPCFNPTPPPSPQYTLLWYPPFLAKTPAAKAVAWQLEQLTMLAQLLVLGTRVTLGSAREQHWNLAQAKFHYPTTLINYDLIHWRWIPWESTVWLLTTVPEIQEPAIEEPAITDYM